MIQLSERQHRYRPSALPRYAGRRSAFLLGLGLCCLWIVAFPPHVRAQSADRLLEQAIGHYHMGDFEKSLEVLGRAEKATKEAKLLGQIYFYRGINFAVLDKEALARQAFILALTNDDQLEIDAEQYKDNIVRLFRSVKRERPQRLSPAMAKPAPKPQPPAAPRPSVIRPGTRPLVLTLGLGGSLGFGDTINQIKIHQGLGYHFSRRSSGFALGFTISEALGEASGTDVFLFQAGPALWWDIQLSSRASFYLTPLLQCAFTYLSRPINSSYSTEGLVALSVQPALELKLLLADRLLLYLRPVSLDILYGGNKLDWEDGMIIRYDLSFGFGVTL